MNRAAIKALPRLKICCLGGPDEAWLALRCGATALGFPVDDQPSGVPNLLQAVREVAGVIGPRVTSVIVTAKTDPQEIIDIYRQCGTTAIQLQNVMPIAAYKELKKFLPGVALVQQVQLVSEEQIDEMRHLAYTVHAIILQPHQPESADPDEAFAGYAFGWELCRKFREKIRRPVFLGGAMNEETVVAAVRFMRPFGVDVCDGARRNGALDEALLVGFIAKMREVLLPVRSTEIATTSV